MSMTIMSAKIEEATAPGRRDDWGRWIVLLLLALGLLTTLYPFFLAAINAIKTPTDYGANGPIAP